MGNMKLIESFYKSTMIKEKDIGFICKRFVYHVDGLCIHHMIRTADNDGCTDFKLETKDKDAEDYYE